MRLTIGIDCGITGAIAVIDENSEVRALHDLPIAICSKAKWIDAPAVLQILRDAVRPGETARAFVELVHAMPKLGTVAANSKGMTLGSTLAALQVAKVPVELIAPQTWKRALGLIDPKATDKAKKAASLSRARLLFPRADLGRVKDHGRAEALLIGHYAQRYLQGREVSRPEPSVAITADDLFGGEAA